MRILALHVAAAAAFLTGTPVFAQDSTASAPAASALPSVKTGDTIRTADGKTVGLVDKVQLRDGQAVSVSLIFNHHFIRIPVSTLSTGAKGLMTSLSRKELARLH